MTSLQTIKICTIKDCATIVRAKGLCGRHYEALRRNGALVHFLKCASCDAYYESTNLKTKYCSKLCYDIEHRRLGAIRRRKFLGYCIMDNCSLPKRSKDFCNKHYLRSRSQVVTQYVNCAVCNSLFRTRRGYQKYCDGQCRRISEKIARHTRARQCTIDGCTRRYDARGFCDMHYRRWRKYGNPFYTSRLRKLPEGEFRRNTGGYMVRAEKVNDRIVVKLQHRLIMEEILGRKLRSFETPHHKNGIRSDNHPDNLELWTKPQPVGQRVSDLVDWVIENYRTEIEVALKDKEKEENQ